MKRITTISIIAVAALIAVTACEKSNNETGNSIEGTYIGSFSSGNDTKTILDTPDEPQEARAEVMMNDNDRLEVHWTGHGMDTTMMLNYYDNHDSVMVCLTGEEFEHQYGHMLGEGHMTGGHMSDMHDGETEWMHHMADEHDADDEHFGGFDMQHHTFSYRFEMMNGDTPYTLTFHGEKTK